MSSVLLGNLNVGSVGRVLRVHDGDSAITQRLLELGFIEGSVVEVVKEAPFGGDPILVKVRGSLLGLRRGEARYIEVESLSS